jgi:fructose 1,6-bisphosphatase
VACGSRKATVSLIKCDVGSLAGHHEVPKPLFNIAEKNLDKAKKAGVIDGYCGSIAEATGVK